MIFTHSKLAIQKQLDEVNSHIHSHYEEGNGWDWSSDDSNFPAFGDMEAYLKKLVEAAQQTLDFYVIQRNACYTNRQSLQDELATLMSLEIEIGSEIKHGKLCDKKETRL